MDILLFTPEFISPKFQLHPVMLPDVMLDVLVKQVLSFKHTEGALVIALGRGFT